jgi:hypothetical protein
MTGIAIGIMLSAARTAVGGAPAYTFVNTEASDLVARFSVEPSESIKEHIDTCIGALKAGAISGANIFAKLRCLCVGWLHDRQAARCDWKGTTYDDMTEAGTGLTWAAAQGFSFNGTGYLTTGVLSNAATPFVTNSSCGLSWEMTNVAQNNGIISGSNSYVLNARNVDGLLDQFVFDFTGMNAAAFSVADSRGFTTWNRSSSTARQAYRNGVEVVNQTGVSSSGGTAAALVWGAGNIGFPSTRTGGVFGLASSVTANEQKDLYNAIRALGVSLGAIASGDFAVAT